MTTATTERAPSRPFAGIPPDVYREWEPCEKWEANAFYCPWENVLITGAYWGAAKSLALHMGDRGAHPSCPARRTQASGRVVTTWGHRGRVGIYPLRPRAHGCGRYLQFTDLALAIHWYVFCEDCGREYAKPGQAITRGHPRIGIECGQSNSDLFYAERVE